MTLLPIVVAFLAGIVSFLSPCVLPLIPGYLVYLAGNTVATRQRDIFANSICFVLGFTVVFALLGVLLNTLLESIAYDVQIWLSRLGGLVIIIFGLYLIGLVKLPWLAREHRVNLTAIESSRLLTSFIFGAAFAVGWTPCVGAVLGGILGLAASQPGSAFILLMSYAVGFGIPFLLVGLFTAPAVKLINRFGAVAGYINKVFGVLLVVLGLLIFTQSLSRYANLEFLMKLL